MTIIPFEEALKLIDRAYDINVPGYSETKSFSLDAAEGAYSFLELSLEDSDNEFFFRFLESANATVKVDVDLMTLVYDDVVVADTPPTIEIRLMAPMALEPSMGAVHKHQCELETRLNYIIRETNLAEIRRHARIAKQAFDWLDNFTVVRASQPKAAAEARPLQEDNQQDDGKDGANDLEGRAGNELAEQPVKEGEDKGEGQHEQECGEQHAAPYQPEVDPATDSFTTPPIILQALKHVRSHNPDVDRVVFWGDGRWSFMTDSLSSPPFMGLIDIGLLEDAANEVADGHPHAFQLPSEEE